MLEPSVEPDQEDIQTVINLLQNASVTGEIKNVNKLFFPLSKARRYCAQTQGYCAHLSHEQALNGLPLQLQNLIGPADIQHPTNFHLVEQQ